MGEGQAGRFTGSHVLVKENSRFGVLSTLVHELNHSDGEASKDVPIYTYKHPKSKGINCRPLLGQSELSEWAINHDGKIGLRNTYFEEVSVHAKALRQLAEAGELELSSGNMGEYKIVYDEGQSAITLPDNIGYEISLHSLAMLEKLSPGIVSELDRSRSDRSHFQAVIDRLNSVDELQDTTDWIIEPRTGLLYENLRDLQANELTKSTWSVYGFGLRGQNLLDIRDIKHSIYDLGVAPD